MNEKQGIKIGALEFNLNHFFRYVYGGFILCLIMILMLPKQSGELYEVLDKNLQGNTFFIFFLLVAIGTGFYSFYKAIISEFIIDGVHFKRPTVLLKHSEKDCVFKYLGTLGVEEKHRLIAFRLIRDKYFNPSIQKVFYLRHSETHVLYLTFTACFIGLLVRLLARPFKISACNNWVTFLIFIIGAISLLSGLYSDRNLCADECYYSRLNEESIKETLKEAKLLKEDV